MKTTVVLLTTADVQGKGAFVITLNDNDDSEITQRDGSRSTRSSIDSQNPLDWMKPLDANMNLLGQVPVTITEQGPNSGVFGTYDESDNIRS